MKKIVNRKLVNLLEDMNDRSSEIIQNLNSESIEVYKFLIEEFQKGDIRKNYLFQFVFRSFYRLDNAGLSTEFKSRFFDLMEANRDNK